VQSKSKISKQVFLLHPPGWSLNYGSPHLGLPLLQGYLKKQNIPCRVIDLNIKATIYYDIGISKNDLDSIIPQKFNESKADTLYYSIVNKLNSIGSKFSGDWKIKSGFNFWGCDLSKSADIRKYSNKISPFTEFYKKEIIPTISNENPIMVGFSVTVPSQLLSTFEFIRLLRNSGYKGKIIIGGVILKM